MVDWLDFSTHRVRHDIVLVWLVCYVKYVLFFLHELVPTFSIFDPCWFLIRMPMCLGHACTLSSKPEHFPIRAYLDLWTHSPCWYVMFFINLCRFIQLQWWASLLEAIVECRVWNGQQNLHYWLIKCIFFNDKLGFGFVIGNYKRIPQTYMIPFMLILFQRILELVGNYEKMLQISWEVSS